MRKWVFAVLTVVLLILAVMTAVPAPASKPCLVGYYAHCSSTPVSTLILLGLAYATYRLWRRYSK